MDKLTLADLRAMREQLRRKAGRREAADTEGEVAVAMGTCGIAAGAETTYGVIRDEMEKHHLGAVRLRRVGCLGLCHSEPNVEVLMPGMPAVIYGKVDEALARRIVAEHMVGQRLVDGAICDRPAVDIVQ